MFDPTSRPMSAQRLVNQMHRLDNGTASDCTIGDLSVNDVFSAQSDLEMDAEPSQQPHPRTSIDPPGPQTDGPQLVGNTGLAATGALAPPLHQKATNRKKKKRQQRRLADVEVGHNTPPLSTVRGFTPMASGDEDSDFSAAGSQAMSPQLNPIPTSNTSIGISALKLQLDALNLSEKQPSLSSNASVSSDSDRTEVLTSYEIPLEHDFISKEAVAEEERSVSSPNGVDMQNDLCRKMTSRDFDHLMCLGKGTFGTVLLVRHKVTGRLYAQKQFRKASLKVHKKLVEQTKTERMILESVNRHPFVVKLYYAFQDHEKLYLILEYAQGGELFTHLAAERMFSEDVAAFYMAEMVLALEHLHKTVGVIYRDLKPENCLLDSEGHLLLTDFGLSKVAVSEDDRCNSSLGTIEYMAPEVIQGKPYGKACDWWSLGALGYDLLTGSPPFKANNHAKIQEKIVRQKLTLPYFLGPDAKDLLIRLLRKEPHKRLGYHMHKDIETIKKHRFFRKIDWKALARRELDAPIQPLITDPALAENFSADFTSLALSPTANDDDRISDMLKQVGLSSESNAGVNDADTFRGFSFVASSSLLNSGFSLTT